MHTRFLASRELRATKTHFLRVTLPNAEHQIRMGTGQLHQFHGEVPFARRISCCYILSSTQHHESMTQKLCHDSLADVLKHCEQEGFTTPPK